MNHNKLYFIVGLLLLIDAVGSMIVQYQDAFFPFHVGRLYRVVVGIFMMLDYHYQKRLFDIIVSSFMILLALPLFIIIPIAIVAESGLPVFFAMERCGENMRRFTLLHYRSMKKGNHKVENLENDPRITRVGQVLRATALDSLPELFNIIKGDVSLVGPRPFPYAVENEPQYQTLDDVPNCHLRHTIKPGLTGLAQVSCDRYASRRIKFKYDCIYIKQANLWLDIKLFIYSIWVAIKEGWD